MGCGVRTFASDVFVPELGFVDTSRHTILSVFFMLSVGRTLDEDGDAYNGGLY